MSSEVQFGPTACGSRSPIRPLELTAYLHKMKKHREASASATLPRLRVLYDDNHQFALHSSRARDCQVTLEIPLQSPLRAWRKPCARIDRRRRTFGSRGCTSTPGEIQRCASRRRECDNGSSAIEKILDLGPDIVFLDVQMPGMDCFEVLRALPKENLPLVIFLTAYEQHALRAFEVHALDYLLKPVDDERFERAIERARRVGDIQSTCFHRRGIRTHTGRVIRSLGRRPRKLRDWAIDVFTTCGRHLRREQTQRAPPS